MDKNMKCVVCAVVLAVMFFLLSPGVLVTLPPKCKGKAIMPIVVDKGCATSHEAALVHALIFGVLAWLVLCWCCKAGPMSGGGMSLAMSGNSFRFY